MPLLEAFLALALTMLSLAMVASLMVEAMNRIFKMRAKDFQRMLEEFYDLELADKVKSELKEELKKADMSIGQYKKEFLQKLTSNPLKVQGLLASNLKPLVELSTTDFFKRLANTKIGKKFKDKAEIEVNEFVDDLGLTYEAYGVAAQDVFRRRSSLISYAAGVVVAVVLNVNALFVLNGYMTNSKLTAEVVAKADLITSRYQSTIATVKDANEEKAKEDDQEVKSVLDELNNNVNEIKDNIATLENEMGLDVGYSWHSDEGVWFVKAFGPWLGDWIPEDAKPVGWSKDQTNIYDFFRFMFYVFGVLATGLLIGLGSPFWYDLVVKITSVLQVVRGGPPTAVEQAAEVEAQAHGVVLDSSQPNRAAFKMTGGTGRETKKKTQLAAIASKAANADLHVKSASDALLRVHKVAEIVENKNDQSIQKALVDAKTALEVATSAQKMVYQQVKNELDAGPVDLPHENKNRS